MSGSASLSAVSQSGQFQAYNGQVIDPQGTVFTAKGIDLSSFQMGDASKILADFPGLNFIRLNVFSYDSPDTYAAFINTMTSRGIVIELEDHTSSDGSNRGGSRGVTYTGTQLASELAWYSSVARAYASNSYVWFGTDNEPPVPGLSLWQQQTYNAIRSTGNNNPILVALPGGGWPDSQTVTSYGMDPAVYAAMSNIIADIHLLGWSSHYIPDQATVDASLANMIQGAQTIPSMDGTVPVILGEYGPSTEGPTLDANGSQVVQAAQQSTQTAGAAALAWSAGSANSLTDAQGNLTPYGQEVAQWIASASGSAFTNVVTTPGRFQTGNGQVLDPHGAVFSARGINLSAAQMGDANKILATLPSLNFIRLNVYNYAPPYSYTAFINLMTSHGVVVELEDHTSSDGANSGGSRGVSYTGTQLANELSWYSSLAQAYKSNPYVWFGTDNEPPVGGISPWQQQTYNAIRSMGNNNPIFVALPGGGWPDGQTVTSYGMDPTVYAAMSNIVADVHMYGWSSHYIPDQATVNDALANMIQSARTIPSMNGTLPVILGEYGPSTDGSTVDANAPQVVQAAQTSTQTSGALAFSWAGGGADTLTDGQDNLTPYGQEVAQWIASGASHPAAVASVQSASMSFIGNSTGSTSGTGGVYVLPAAGSGVLALAGDVLDAGGTLDLTAALAATDWNGTASTLPGYLAVTDTSAGATISIAPTFDGSATAIATIAGATSLDLKTLLAHAMT